MYSREQVLKWVDSHKTDESVLCGSLPVCEDIPLSCMEEPSEEFLSLQQVRVKRAAREFAEGLDTDAEPE